MKKKMYTKTMFVLLIGITLLGCTNDEPVNPPELIEVDRTAYMHTVSLANTNCLEEDYISLNIDGRTLEYYYGRPNGGVGLCSFNEGNVDGLSCSNCEGSFAALPMPLSYQPFFPDLPMQEGTIISTSFGDLPVTDMVMRGFYFNFRLPTALHDNIVPGVYRITQVPTDLGVSLSVNWAVEFDGGFTGYELIMDADQVHHFEIECVDRSDDEFIRISGNFEGMFETGTFYNGTPLAHEVPISGAFSYKITL